MKEIIITTAMLTTFCYGLITEMNILKDTAAELKASVQVFDRTNERLLNILEKDIYLVNKNDFKPFEYSEIKKEQLDLKKIALEELVEESRYLVEKYKDLDFESLTEEELRIALENVKKEMKEKEGEVKQIDFISDEFKKLS